MSTTSNSDPPPPYSTLPPPLWPQGGVNTAAATPVMQPQAFLMPSQAAQLQTFVSQPTLPVSAPFQTSYTQYQVPYQIPYQVPQLQPYHFQKPMYSQPPASQPLQQWHYHQQTPAMPPVFQPQYAHVTYPGYPTPPETMVQYSNGEGVVGEEDTDGSANEGVQVYRIKRIKFGFGRKPKT